MSKKTQRPAGGMFSWNFWCRFYLILLLIFAELVTYAFQNIEKKRLGYELAVLVKHKRQLMETRNSKRNELLLSESLPEIAATVQSASLELQPNYWPIVWVGNHE